MTTYEIQSNDAKRIVKIVEQGGRFTSRLYVNSGNTATTITRKALTLAGAQKQAARMLAA